MRYRAKVDDNQAEIVADLRALGCSVLDLSRVGGGAPDLCVGYGSRNYLLEVVGADKLKRFPPDGRTTNQVEWHECWRGSVYTVTCTDDAVKVMCIPVIGGKSG